jgi:hypothetical protein
MKQSEIKAGETYGNGATRRTVAGIGEFTPTVRFIENCGSEQIVWLSTFARWAQFRVDPDTTPEQLLVMQAKSLRLSQGQQAFLKSLLPDLQPYLGNPAGLSFDVMHTETRLVRDLERKGLAQYNKDHRVAKLTPLGLAYLGLAHANQQQKENQA